MEYIYDIKTAESDKKASVGLSICHTIDNLVELFLSAFLIAYIYKFSANIFDYLLKVSIYEIVCWASMLITYIISSHLVDKTDRIGIFRLSMFLWAGIILFLYYLAIK